jgi:hypothetical protein
MPYRFSKVIGVDFGAYKLIAVHPIRSGERICITLSGEHQDVFVLDVYEYSSRAEAVVILGYAAKAYQPGEQVEFSIDDPVFAQLDL